MFASNCVKVTHARSDFAYAGGMRPTTQTRHWFFREYQQRMIHLRPSRIPRRDHKPVDGAISRFSTPSVSRQCRHGHLAPVRAAARAMRHTAQEGLESSLGVGFHGGLTERILESSVPEEVHCILVRRVKQTRNWKAMRTTASTRTGHEPAARCTTPRPSRSETTSSRPLPSRPAAPPSPPLGTQHINAKNFSDYYVLPLCAATSQVPILHCWHRVRLSQRGTRPWHTCYHSTPLSPDPLVFPSTNHISCTMSTVTVASSAERSPFIVARTCGTRPEARPWPLRRPRHRRRRSS